jgi:hypothetical protein
MKNMTALVASTAEDMAKAALPAGGKGGPLGNVSSTIGGGLIPSGGGGSDTANLAGYYDWYNHASTDDSRNVAAGEIIRLGGTVPNQPATTGGVMTLLIKIVNDADRLIGETSAALKAAETTSINVRLSSVGV